MQSIAACIPEKIKSILLLRPCSRVLHGPHVQSNTGVGDQKMREIKDFGQLVDKKRGFCAEKIYMPLQSQRNGEGMEEKT